MDREIDLIKYLPGILQDVKEYKALAETQNPEALSTWVELENVLNDQFINESTANGVNRWEKILKIKPLDTDTLDERKFRVLSKLNEKLPYTMRNLNKQLTFLCGQDGYSITSDNDNFTIAVRVALTSKKNYAEVEKLLDRVIPCNMLLDLSLLYNQHSAFKLFTHAQLKSFTNYQLRNEVVT